MYPNPIDECLEKGEYHVERIKCPNCGYIQQAEVVHTQPWSMYVHSCRHCDYIIMESEWNCIDVEIKLPFSMKRFFRTVTTLELRFFLAVICMTEATISFNWLLIGQENWWTPLAVCTGITVGTYLMLLIKYLNKKR